MSGCFSLMLIIHVIYIHFAFCMISSNTKHCYKGHGYHNSRMKVRFEITLGCNLQLMGELPYHPWNILVVCALLCFVWLDTSWYHPYHSGPLFTKRTDVLPQDLGKSRSREAGCYYTPTQRSCWVGGGYVGFTQSVRLSVRPSTRLSVCPASRVRSVAPTVLVGSISYLHILSSNFRRCVACNGSCKNSIFQFLAIF